MWKKYLKQVPLTVMKKSKKQTLSLKKFKIKDI